MINKKGHVISFDDSPLSYAENINSSDYNKILNSLKSGVLRAMNRSRETTTKLDSFNKAIQGDNLTRARLDDYNKSRAVVRSTFASNYGFVSGFDQLILDGNSSGFRQSSLFGTVTCGYTDNDKLSKITRYTDANGVRRPSNGTSITFGKVGMATELPSTHSIYNILDNKMDTFWIEDVDVGDEYLLDISLPTSIKPTLNALELIPFPSHSFEIVSIKVYQADSSILDITQSAFNGVNSIGAGPMQSHFKPVSWGNRISIVIKPITSVIGISNIDLFTIQYNDNATIMFKVPQLDSSVGEFSTVRIDPTMNHFGFTFYGDNDSDVSTWNSSDVTVTFHDGIGGLSQIVKPDRVNFQPLPFTSNTNNELDLYISIKFNKKNGQTPVFNHLAFLPN